MIIDIFVQKIEKYFMRYFFFILYWLFSMFSDGFITFPALAFDNRVV